MKFAINSRFLNFEFSAFENRQIESNGVSTKGLTWQNLWLRSLEDTISGNKLVEPYSQYPWMYVAINAIALPVSQVPFILYKGEDTLMESGPVYDLFMRPNPYTSRFQFWQAIITFLKVEGNAFVLLSFNKSKLFPSEMWVFGSEKMEALTDSNGQLVAWRMKNNNVTIPPEQVIHFKEFNPKNMISGLSPVTVARLTMETDYGALKYNKAIIDNDAEPGGVILSEHKLNDIQIKQLRKDFETRHQGPENAKRLAIISGAKYQRVSLSPKDMEFLEQRRYSREEILSIWRIPKGVVGITDDLNYATLFGQKRIFWNDTLLPVMKMLEDGFAAQFFRRYAPDHWAEFDRKSVPELQEDYNEKVASAEILNRIGYPINMINKRLDLGFEDVPWGDIWFAPMTSVPVSSADSIPEGGNGNGKPELPPANEEDEEEERIMKMPAAIEAVRLYGTMEKYVRLWGRFIQAVTPNELVFASKLRRYFYEQRNIILEALLKNEKALHKSTPDVITFKWGIERKKLEELSRKQLNEAILAGIKLLSEVLGAPAIDAGNPMIEEAILRRCTKITGIVVETTRTQIQKTLLDGVVAGESINQLADRIKAVFNAARYRVNMIARTEVIGATNEGGMIEMQNEAVEKKQWLTAGDEYVRDSHRDEGAGDPIPLDATFPVTHLHYPGDPNGPAGEVINCRCTLIPVQVKPSL